MEARVYNGEKTVLSKWLWGNQTATCERMKLEHSLSQHKKLNSKWSKSLNVSPEIRKLLEENISRTFFEINQSNIFWTCLLKQKK